MGVYSIFVKPLVFVWMLCFISISCSFNKDVEQNVWDYSLIKGTWQGELCYTQLFSARVHSPLIEDSITKIVDSVYVIKNVTVDFGKEKAHFYGVKNSVSSVYHYTLNDGVLLFDIPSSQQKPRGKDALIVFGTPNAPEGAIDKLDGDSLIFTINVYKNGQFINNRLKLKRRT